MSSTRLRKGRCSLPGQTYVVTTVCNHRHRWFEDHDAATIAMDQLRELDQRGCARSLAWVVMPDHVHWLLELQSKPLDDVMRRFKSSSALAFNRAYGRGGALWQSGYHDHAVRSDESLRRHAMYILCNPIRAGLAAAIGDYPYMWSLWPHDR
ncbi:REP-associated tyrosine transposase [Stenotrophomonas rhizophila]|uniref:REP-associated tyrosine transposase n=1 Tax=Stenotrophomonas rhizophila TaxID=216778 RepID=UPI001E3AC847|nr:transposase [Stenotrophomonas rhizophila]MCC7635136.1 transposase [Stenotrophomonas rhizophila]MCC7664848.1 transposase [Stenotrophomonas rhizophila]